MGGARTVPGLRAEKQLLRGGHTLLVGVDEVGRGALCGPVTVGVVGVDLTVGRVPAGLRDSKLLTPEARQALVPRIRRWATCWAVGHASAAEIDAMGILAALRLAGIRAIGALPRRPDCVLLDGNYDWLTRPQLPLTLFGPAPDDLEPLPVRLMVKADLRCASVAAASVLAKTERDDLVARLAVDHPGYGWELNRGYATPEHLAALRTLGPCAHHRRSWRLPSADDLGVRVPCRQDEVLDLDLPDPLVPAAGEPDVDPDVAEPADDELVGLDVLGDDALGDDDLGDDELDLDELAAGVPARAEPAVGEPAPGDAEVRLVG